MARNIDFHSEPPGHEGHLTTMLMPCKTNNGAEVMNIEWTRQLTGRWKSYYNTYASVEYLIQSMSQFRVINCGEGER